MADGDAPETQLAELRARIEHVESVLAIQALKARYGELVDQRFSRGAVVDPAMLDDVVARIIELFTEDAVWDGGAALGVAVGRDAIATRLRAPTIVFSRHLFTRPNISVDASTATARWDLLCPCRTPDGRSWWMAGYEDDEYRLEGGSWRHARMRLTTLFMAEAGTAFDPIVS